MNKQKLTFILILVLMLVGATAALADGNPKVYDNWDSGNAAFECAAIGDYDYGYKVDAAAPNGSWTHEGNTITILNSDGYTFDWEATSSIGAVIVKAGTGANVWFYDPQAMSDTGLYGYEDREISHVTFCWDAVMDYEELTVEKTAVTAYTRTHDWSIDKNVDPTELYLYIDGSGDATATWTVDVFYQGYTDSDFNVSGIITTTNTGTLDAVINTVDDVLAGTPIVVDCGVEFPYTLPVGDTLTCSYSEDVVGKIAGTNEVSVTTEVRTYAAESVDLIWGDPTNEVNATVTVVDYSDLFGSMTLGTVTAPDNAQFTYTKKFAWADYGQDNCGDHTYNNMAKVIGDGGVVLDYDDAVINVYVQCYIYETAYAKGDDAKCFIDNGFDKWGWTNPVMPGTYEMDLWAAAGQCDTNKGTLVGTVSVVYGADGYVTVAYNVGAPYLLDETHVYAGYGMFPLDNKGKETVAPGQYYNASPFDGNLVYVIAHAVVGIPDPDFGP